MSQQAVAAPNAAPKTAAYAWVVLFALYMATLAATLNLFKLPPVMTVIQKAFTVGNVETGDLMSIFSIMGFVLAIPAGYILKRFGIKMAGLISVGAVTFGSALGALATTFGMLYVGRFIEGVGMGLIMVAAPFAISVWFPLHNRALPTGLWASSVGIGNVVMLLIAPSLAVSYKWPSVWWAGAGFSALAFILFAILFRMPKQEEMYAAPTPVPVTEEKPLSHVKDIASTNEKQDNLEKNILYVLYCGILGATIFSGLFYLVNKLTDASYSLVWGLIIGWVIGALAGFKIFPIGVNRSFCMISISFGCYNLVVMAMCTFLPVFLEVVRGYSTTYDKGVLMNAGFVTAFIMAASIFSAPLGGSISDRLGKRKLMVLIPYILMAVTFLFPFTIGVSMIPWYMIAFGFFGGPIAPILLAAVPEVARKPQLIGIGMAVAAMGQNIGMYIGPSLFPRIMAAYGWEAAGFWMIPICLVGIIATCFIKVR